jgi:hypothetical protein
MDTIGDTPLATATKQNTAADCLQPAFLRRVGVRQLVSASVNCLNPNSIVFRLMESYEKDDDD